MESKELSIIQDTTKELIALCNLPKNQIKREMDTNYLSMLVKQNPNLKQEHFIEFITKCQLSGADPRMNQIYLIVHDSWNSQTQTKEPKGTTVFSYQYFIKLAQQTGQLEDFEVETITDEYLDFNTTRKRPSITSKAWVKRKGQGKLNYKARLWEFAKTSKDGALMGNWKVSPYLMLEKCAVANVMRWAFPEVLGNYYVADEMERATASTEKVIPTKVYSVLTETAQIEEKPKEPFEPIEVIETVAEMDEFGFEKDIEDYRKELITLIEEADPSFFTKIGKDKYYMMAKVDNETDLTKMKSMYDFVVKVKI